MAVKTVSTCCVQACHRGDERKEKKKNGFGWREFRKISKQWTECVVSWIDIANSLFLWWNVADKVLKEEKRRRKRKWRRKEKGEEKESEEEKAYE